MENIFFSFNVAKSIFVADIILANLKEYIFDFGHLNLEDNYKYKPKHQKREIFFWNLQPGPGNGQGPKYRWIEKKTEIERKMEWKVDCTENWKSDAKMNRIMRFATFPFSPIFYPLEKRIGILRLLSFRLHSNRPTLNFFQFEFTGNLLNWICLQICVSKNSFFVSMEKQKQKTASNSNSNCFFYFSFTKHTFFIRFLNFINFNNIPWFFQEYFLHLFTIFSVFSLGF